MARQLKRTRCRGLEAVEAALIFPLLFFITLGMLQYALIFWRIQQMTNVTRQAARLAALPNVSASQVNAQISSQMSAFKLSGYTATLTPGDPNAAAVGAPVNVTITMPYSSLTFLPSFPSGGSSGNPWFWLPVPTNVKSSISMAKEGV